MSLSRGPGRGRLLLMLVELGGAMWIAWQQLPPDERQQFRMRAYQTGARVGYKIAYRIARQAIRLEAAYAEEMSA